MTTHVMDSLEHVRDEMVHIVQQPNHIVEIIRQFDNASKAIRRKEVEVIKEIQYTVMN